MIQLELITTGGRGQCRAVLHWFQGALGWRITQDVAVVEKSAGAAAGLLTGAVSRGAVSDGHGAVLGVSSFETVSTVRKMTGKPHLLRLVSVDVVREGGGGGGGGSSGSSDDNATLVSSRGDCLSNADLFRLSFGNSATVTPRLGRVPINGTLTASTASTATLPAAATYPLKEVALGCSSDHDAMFDYAHSALPQGDFPGLFRASGQGGATGSGGSSGTSISDCTLRLLPSQVSSLIFRVPSFESALQRQEIENSVSGKIGFRASKTGQLLLSPPFAGLDLRLCESLTSDQSFDEGNAVLMENVLRGIGDTAHASQLSCGAVLRKEFVGLAKKDKL
jgi:hypothetical protein